MCDAQANNTPDSADLHLAENHVPGPLRFGPVGKGFH